VLLRLTVEWWAMVILDKQQELRRQLQAGQY